MTISTKFFTRKNLIITAIVVLTLYVAIWATALIIQTTHDSRAKHAAAILKKQYDAQTPEYKAVLKAQQYLKNSLGTVQVEQRLVLDYLQRQFNLDESLSAAKTPFQIVENPRTYPQEINFLARISYPEKLVTVPPRNVVDGPILTNIYSANCDHVQLPANFWSTMNDNYKQGGYYVTHDALAFAFIRDNSCTIPTSESELQSKVVDSMVKLAGDPNTNSDLRYEAIAFLGLSGHAPLIDSKWIDKVIAEQKSDGSWVDGKDVQNRDHTTTLALWALLEYRKPNVRHEPLIRHTSGQ